MMVLASKRFKRISAASKLADLLLLLLLIFVVDLYFLILVENSTDDTETEKSLVVLVL